MPADFGRTSPRTPCDRHVRKDMCVPASGSAKQSPGRHPSAERVRRLRLRVSRMAGDTSGRIVILASAILLLWLGGALFGTLINAYPTFNEAVWDSIWHMIDPGALGDDENTKQRVLGSLLAISGLVILAGAALTLFEELVDRALGRLGAADPPLSVAGHLLVIGENRSLPAIVGRVAADPEGPSSIVILVDAGEPSVRQTLRRRLEAEVKGSEIAVVGGDIRDDGLERVCADRAAAIVVLAPETGNVDATDLRVLGIGAVLASMLPEQDRPPISLQMNRGRNVDVVWDRFSPDFDALVEDRVTAATLGLCLAHPAFAELFSGRDSETVVFLDGLEGVPFSSVIDLYPDLLPIAVTQGTGALIEPHFAPAPEHKIGSDERVIAFGEPAAVKDESRRRPRTRLPSAPTGEKYPEATGPAGLSIQPATGTRRLMIIGWSDAAESLVGELLAPQAGLRLTLVDDHRSADPTERVGALQPEFLTGDLRDSGFLRSALEKTDPDCILIAAAPERDALAAFTALRLEQLLRGSDGHPEEQSRPALIVQQSSAERARQLRLGLEHGHVVSAAELTGETVAYSATTPETLATWEQMANGAVAAIERVKVGAGSNGHQEARFVDLYRLLSGQGMIPFALARGGSLLDESLAPDDPVHVGDELLVVRRLA